MKQRTALAFIGLIALLMVAGCSRGKAEIAAAPTPDITTLQQRTLDVLRDTIDRHYVYEELAADWQADYDDYRSRIEAGIDSEAFTSELAEILNTLPAPPVLQTRDERITQAATVSTSYGGIGAFVTLRDEPQPHIVLLSVMPNSPAEAAGLAAHDSIFAIDGQPVEGGDVSLSINRMRGEPGSDVVIIARTPGEAEREVVVTRGDIQSSSATIEVQRIGPQEDIAYILFPPAPYPNMLDGIFSQIETLSAEQPLSGLILDLRIVGQSDAWPVAEMFTVFGSGDLGEIYTREGSTPLDIEGRDVLMSQSLPLAILVGPDTRGTLEMFAAALQTSGRAQVFGLTTPGLLEGVTPFFLPDGSRLLVPTSSYRTPDGRETGLDGVIPDVVIEADWDEVTTENDPVLEAAVEGIGAEIGD